MVIVSGRSALKSVPRNGLRNAAKIADAPASGRRRSSRNSAGFNSPDVRIAATNGARRGVSALRQYRRLSSRAVRLPSRSLSSRVALRLSSSKFTRSNNRNVLTSDVRRLQAAMMDDVDAALSRFVPCSRINRASVATQAPIAVVPIVNAPASSRIASVGSRVTVVQLTGRASAVMMDHVRAVGSGPHASGRSVWMK